MPKSQIMSMYADSGYAWTCPICNKEINNKSIRAINRCKKLHYKYNPECKAKVPQTELSRQIHAAPTTIIKGSPEVANQMDTMMASKSVLGKDTEQILNIERVML